MNWKISPAASALIAMAGPAGSVLAAPTIDSYNSVCKPTAGRYSHTSGNFAITAAGPICLAQSQWRCRLADKVQIVLRHLCVKDSTGTRV
jgi:hypothetical protein